MGYTKSGDKKSLTLKLGQLASAFGDFTRNYSDTSNALIDSPQPYGTYLLLRPDQLPCSNYDLQHQQGVHPNISAYHCTSLESYNYGILPVNPYGVFGGEANWNYGSWDARVQITNSSPSNPKSIFSADQALQWAAGAGYSFSNGLRMGFSSFDGPWLEGTARREAKKHPLKQNSCACGQGVDLRYSRGRYSVSGEWMQIQFQYPGFKTGPKVTYAYVESKVILTPRVYFAARIGRQGHNQVRADDYSVNRIHTVVELANDPSEGTFQPNKQSFELVLGMRPTRHTLFKIGQQWVNRSPSLGPKDHMFLMQIVTSLPDLWLSFEKNRTRGGN